MLSSGAVVEGYLAGLLQPASPAVAPPPVAPAPAREAASTTAAGHPPAPAARPGRRAPPPAPAATITRWVLFELAGQTYGVDVLHVQEVLRVPELTKVPGAPTHVSGVINLRGAIVTVMDLRGRMGLPPQPATDASRIIVGQHGGLPVGVMVDRVAEILQLRAADVQPAPNVGIGPHMGEVLSVVDRPDGMVILLEIGKLIAGSEGF